MFNFQILNNPDFFINFDVINKIFQLISINIEKKQKWTLNIVFVSLLEMQELNKNYRKKDYGTDVLSFHYFEDFDNLNDEDIAWELIFCEEKIKNQALEFWLWYEKEFYKLLIHSILHIIWYDHEEDNEYEVMKIQEKNVWNELFL